jgi:malate dehydrogenase
VLKAAKGEKGLVEPSYVYLPGVPGGKEIAEKVKTDFFSVPVELGVSVEFLWTRLSCGLPR